MNLDRVLVTGAAGFIGSHLAHRLVDAGATSVIGVDNLRSGDWSRCPSSIKRIERDLNDISIADWIEILQDIDSIYHLAAEKYNSSKSTPEKLLNTNIIATERLFRAAARKGVRRVVFSSSLYAYGILGNGPMKESDIPGPSTLYGASKLAGEHMLRSLEQEFGLSWNVARLFFIFGPKQFAEGGYKSVINSNFERLLRGQSPQVNGDGEQTLDYVFIDDCIEALLRLGSSSRERKTVNVASNRGVSIVELTRLMQTVAESDLQPYFAQPDWTHGTVRVGNNDLAKSIFGWETKVPLEVGLRKTFAWMQGAA